MRAGRLDVIALALAALALALTAANGVAPGTETTEDVHGLAQMEREAVRHVNAVRARHARAPLEVDPVLVETARRHSCRMAEQGYLGHQAPDGDTVADRVREAGKSFRLVGENLARIANDPDPVATAVEGWVESPGHRENVLRAEFTLTGVGICRGHSGYYLTQVFLRPRG